MRSSLARGVFLLVREEMLNPENNQTEIMRRESDYTAAALL